MKKYIIILTPFLFLSCYSNKACKENYIGIFRIDTTQTINQTAKKYIQEYRLDTINLISNSNGKYYFQGTNPILEECDGEWFTESNDIEGNCTGYIKQRNRDKPFPRIAFDIFIKIKNETYILPFRKIK